MNAETYLGPKLCIDFAAEHMSDTVLNDMPPSKADASLRFGVTISAIAKSSSLKYRTTYFMCTFKISAF